MAAGSRGHVALRGLAVLTVSAFGAAGAAGLGLPPLAALTGALDGSRQPRGQVWGAARRGRPAGARRRPLRRPPPRERGLAAPGHRGHRGRGGHRLDACAPGHRRSCAAWSSPAAAPPSPRQRSRARRSPTPPLPRSRAPAAGAGLAHRAHRPGPTARRGPGEDLGDDSRAHRPRRDADRPPRGLALAAQRAAAGAGRRPRAVADACRALYRANHARVGDDPDLVLPGTVLHPEHRRLDHPRPEGHAMSTSPTLSRAATTACAGHRPARPTGPRSPSSAWARRPGRSRSPCPRCRGPSPSTSPRRPACPRTPELRLVTGGGRPPRTSSRGRHGSPRRRWRCSAATGRSQLLRWTSQRVYADLGRRVSILGRSSVVTQRLRTVRPQVRSVHVFQPTPQSAEVSVHVRHGRRSRAIAARLELEGGRWQCTALQLG